MRQLVGKTPNRIGKIPCFKL